MSLRYSGSAVLRSPAGVFEVHAELSTDVSGGVYSWGGRLHTPFIAAIRAAHEGGTLSIPDHLPVKVHVTHTELGQGGGVHVRVDGHGRAPYEQDGDITASRGEDGATVYQAAEEAQP